MLPERHHIWKKWAALLLVALLGTIYAIKALHHHPFCERKTEHCYTCEFQLTPAHEAGITHIVVSLPVCGIIFAVAIPAFHTISPDAAINRGPPALA